MNRVLRGSYFAGDHSAGLTDFMFPATFDFGTDKLVVAGHVGDYAGTSRVSGVTVFPTPALTSFAFANAGTFGSISLWQVVNPPTEIGYGFTDLFYSFSSDPGAGAMFYMCHANVDQATPIDGIQTFGSLGDISSHSATVDSRDGDLCVAVYGFGNSTSGPPAGTNGATKWFDFFFTNGGSALGTAVAREFSVGATTLMGLDNGIVSNMNAAVYYNVRSARKSGWINRKWTMRNPGTQGTGAWTSDPVEFDGQSKMYVACRACPTIADNTGTWTDLTISGNSLSYTSIGGVDGPVSRKIYQRHWWADIPAAATFGLTFDAGAANILSYLVDVFEIVGLSDPNPVRAVATDTDLVGGAKTLTLTPFTATDLVFAYSHIRWTGTFTNQTMTGWRTPYFYVEPNDTLTSAHFRDDPDGNVTWQDLFDGTGYEGAGLFAVGFRSDSSNARVTFGPQGYLRTLIGM